MNVHDLIFFGGSLALTVSLIPAVRGKIQMPLVTSVTLMLVIALFTANYASMGFFLSAIVVGIQTGFWGLIAWRGWQAWCFERRKKRSWYATWHSPTRRYPEGWNELDDEDEADEACNEGRFGRA